MHICVVSFIDSETQEKRKDSQWSCFVWTFSFKLLVGIHKLYNIHLKLRKNSDRLSKTFSGFTLPESLMKTPAWINMLDQFYSSFCRKFCNQEKFRKICENFMLKRTIAITEKLQRIKYITLFKHAQFRTVFRIQLNIYDRAFFAKIVKG